MSHARYVAIVDDDAAVRKGIARLLRAHGVESRTYASGRGLLDALPSETPDCVIADVNMPEMTGFELQSELARRGLRIPTVVITGVDDESHSETCSALGAVAYLRKPVEGHTLIAAIMPYLRPKQQNVG
jgi:two-component system response regulator FixJ